MRLPKLLFTLLAFWPLPGQVHCQVAQPWPSVSPRNLGPQGAEGEPDRAQHWLIPSSAVDTPDRAVLFRPPGDGPFRLAVIAHASTRNALRRAQMPQPEYRALTRFLIVRGFAVLVPERLGDSATGRNDLEHQGGCDEVDGARSARATAAQIALAHEFMRGQSFIQKDAAVIIGDSAGGWGALALAHESPNLVSAIIAFAPGRAGDVPGQLCPPRALIAAAAEFGKTARVPLTWLVAANDSDISPELSRQLAGAFRGAGGRVDFRVLPGGGSDGRSMAETESGIATASSELDRALELQPSTALRKR